MGDLRRAAWPRTLFCALITAIFATSFSGDPVSAEQRKRYDRDPISTTGVRTGPGSAPMVRQKLTNSAVPKPLPTP